MKKLVLLSSLFAAVLALPAFADGVKLQGEAVCAKCQLHTADKCRAAVVVTNADGTKTTYLSEATPEAKELHGEICKGSKPATVEGTVSDKDGGKVITITKYEITK